LIKKVGVVGAGTMGAGIAQVTAEAGYEVILIDLEDKFVNRGMENILKNWR
jgi:3-hydroxybutyryl-CoA dehydrogenase